MATMIHRLNEDEVQTLIGVLHDELKHWRDDADTLDKEEIVHLQRLNNLHQLLTIQCNIAQHNGERVVITTEREVLP